MKRDEALKVLSDNFGRLEEFPVVSLSVFGSVARDEAVDASDVDVLVEFEPEARVSLFTFAALQQRLEEILGCRVDLGTSDMLRERIRPRVLREAIRVAWRLATAHLQTSLQSRRDDRI